jgi:hypothetical protein
MTVAALYTFDPREGKLRKLEKILLGLYDPEDKGTRVIWNVRKFYSSNTASHTRNHTFRNKVLIN